MRHSRFLVVRLLLAAVAVAVVGRFSAPAAVAAGLDKLDTSLKMIPDDAAFYSSLLKGGELVEAIGHSKAWSKLKQLQYVQFGLMQYQFMAAMPDTIPAKIEAFRNSEDGQKLLRLLGEMGSEEMFAYGDPSQIKFVDLLQDLAAAYQSPLAAFEEMAPMISGRRNARVKAVLEALARDEKLIGVPNVVFGFKVKNTAAAKEHLAKLERLVTGLVEAFDVSKLKGRLNREKLNDVEYLVLRLDGSMLPWDDMPAELLERLKELEAKEGDVQKIIDRVKSCKLVVALGVRRNYVLLSIG
jgi:hypothetical protein